MLQDAWTIAASRLPEVPRCGVLLIAPEEPLATASKALRLSPSALMLASTLQLLQLPSQQTCYLRFRAMGLSGVYQQPLVRLLNSCHRGACAATRVLKTSSHSVLLPFHAAYQLLHLGLLAQPAECPVGLGRLSLPRKEIHHTAEEALGLQDRLAIVAPRILFTSKCAFLLRARTRSSILFFQQILMLCWNSPEEGLVVNVGQKFFRNFRRNVAECQSL